MAKGEHQGDNNAFYSVRADELIKSICTFTQKCLGTGNLPKREVVLECSVKGAQDFRQGDLLTIKCSVIKPKAVKAD